MAEVEIQSLTMRPDGLWEIAYMEERDQSQSVGIIRVLVVEKEKVQDMATDIEDSLRELVDEALRVLRDEQQ